MGWEQLLPAPDDDGHRPSPGEEEEDDEKQAGLGVCVCVCPPIDDQSRVTHRRGIKGRGELCRSYTQCVSEG